MKTGLTILLILSLIFFILQGFITQSTNKVEQYSYEVLEQFPEFEVRKYKAAMFTSVNLNEDTYKSKSSGGFRILAGYIFGGNERGESIAMTSPVAMDLGKSTGKMSFMVPSGYTKKDLPKPDNQEIYFESKQGCVMAAIRFGGWANDNKIEIYMNKLKEELMEAGLKHKDNFSYFGYNPPYELINRRNEVVVELTDF